MSPELDLPRTYRTLFRAFEHKTGQLLWQDRLPAGGHAVPTTYYSKRCGRQFVVIPASGQFLDEEPGGGLSDCLRVAARVTALISSVSRTGLAVSRERPRGLRHPSNRHIRQAE
jgi:hypothetical protein